MSTIEPLVVDVREELRKGGEPLPHILAAVKKLAPGQALRLFATFEPIPLYAVLGHQGFEHSAKKLGAGDWEVLFTPGAAKPKPKAEKPQTAGAKVSTDGWPAPATELDNRGLQPPEPLVRILDALEHLAPGEVLAAINERDPVFLYPELEARGAAIHTDKQADGVHLLIRRGG
ncbi:MAG: DUF2249 domain-containing protein [Gammaproteobacteria bacterium]